ncbi:muscle M-line assembly protein unc-89 [Pseudorasbora parva]|uniref:muscle M-line assembly protein unc-89 n=1 Tax=Pseudorasbora parva TaxID=51549 RepID=UPI00351E117B
MRNRSLLIGVVLLVQGVFGSGEVKSVSVMVGDSVTLHTDLTETKGFDELQWEIQGESNIIAQIDREANTVSVPGNEEERFRDRLKLDDQTGFLTITNIRTSDSRVYELQIKSSTKMNKYRFSVSVRDVFFVDSAGAKSVSVTEGDYVTLHTGVTDKQSGDVIQWKFGDQDLNGPGDTMSNIDLNKETGEITIRNIRRDQTGDYKLEINTSSMILHRKFDIAVDEMKTVSVMEGESVTLRTGLIEIQGYDLILWKFGDHLVAEIIKSTNQLSLYDTGDKRFKDRLQLNEKTGSLLISKSENTDSGVYHLNMSSSSHTVQRSISVTVSDRSGAVSGISGASVGLMLWAVAVFLLKEV